MSVRPSQHYSSADEFQLEESLPANDHLTEDFELEAPEVQADESIQGELYLPEESNPEAPLETPQLELKGMAPPVYAVELESGDTLKFQHAHTLLESLEAQDVDVHFQCREGYCGSCRAKLLKGEIHQVNEPLAWLNDDEILLCCSIPRSNIKLKL